VKSLPINRLHYGQQGANDANSYKKKLQLQERQERLLYTTLQEPASQLKRLGRYSVASFAIVK
jgi:hypothetical protein